jgi:hypothetical protein
MIKLLIVIVIIIIIIVLLQLNIKYNLSYIEGEVKETSLKTYDSFSIQSPFFNNSEIYSLNNNQAVVIYSNIPYKYLYWNITGYIYEYKNVKLFRQINNNINSKNIVGSFNSHMAIIMTSNSLLYSIIKEQFKIKWKKYHMYNNTIIPIYLDSSEIENAKYTILIRTILSHSLDELPSFKCRFYTANNIANVLTTQNYKIPFLKYHISNYKKILSNEEWKLATYKYLVNNNIKIIKLINVNPLIQKHDLETNNNGLISNYIAFESENITLSSNEKIVIFAMDHSKNNNCLFSSLSFKENDKEYKNIITGDIKNINTIHLNNKNIFHIIEHKHYNTFKIYEFIFGESDISPNYNDINNFVAYVCNIKV